MPGDAPASPTMPDDAPASPTMLDDAPASPTMPGDTAGRASAEAAGGAPRPGTVRPS